MSDLTSWQIQSIYHEVKCVLDKYDVPKSVQFMLILHGCPTKVTEIFCSQSDIEGKLHMLDAAKVCIDDPDEEEPLISQ